MIRLITSASEVGRAFIAPPNVPTERIRLLRETFASIVRMPDFIAAARKRAIDIEFLSGEALSTLVSGHMGQSADIVARAREVVVEKR